MINSYILIRVIEFDIVHTSKQFFVAFANISSAQRIPRASKTSQLWAQSAISREKVPSYTGPSVLSVSAANGIRTRQLWIRLRRWIHRLQCCKTILARVSLISDAWFWFQRILVLRFRRSWHEVFLFSPLYFMGDFLAFLSKFPESPLSSFLYCIDCRHLHKLACFIFCECNWHDDFSRKD